MWIYYLSEPLILPLFFAIWIFIDAQRRNNEPAKWTLGAFFLAPFVVPNYFASRNLKKGEVRKGGVNWHRCKYFAFYWAVFTLWFMFFSGFSQFSLIEPVREQAFGSFGLFMIWAIPTGLVLFVGLYLKKPSKIKEGPTGSLA